MLSLLAVFVVLFTLYLGILLFGAIIMALCGVKA